MSRNPETRRGGCLAKGWFPVSYYSSIKADDFTCIQMIYWRTSLRRDEAKYFYRRISSCGSVTCSFRKDLPRICVFPSHLESRNCDISEDITELIKQLLKLYEGLTERYRERINWLEEDCNDNSCRCQPVPVDEGCNQGQEQGRGLEFLSRKSKD